MIALKCEFPLHTPRSNQICSYKCAMRKKSWKAGKYFTMSPSKYKHNVPPFIT